MSKIKRIVGFVLLPITAHLFLLGAISRYLVDGFKLGWDELPEGK